MILRQFFDGDYEGRVPVGPVVTWIDDETRATMHSATYQQLASHYVPTALSVAGPKGGYCVDSGRPVEIDSGLLEWTEVYAVVPAAHYDFESYSYQEVYSYVSDGDVKHARTPTMTYATRLTHRYVHSLDPSAESLESAWRMEKVEGIIYIIGSTPWGSDEDWFLVEDEQLSRWRGNIFRITRREIRTDRMILKPKITL